MFAVSWIKAMMSQMPLNYQRSRFTWRNCGCTPSVYVCSLLASFPFGGVVRSHAKAERKRRHKCNGQGKRGRIFFLALYRSSQFLLIRPQTLYKSAECWKFSYLLVFKSCYEGEMQSLASWGKNGHWKVTLKNLGLAFKTHFVEVSFVIMILTSCYVRFY